MWPNENIVKLEAIREEHDNPRILSKIENLIGLYEVLDLIWATVDGNFTVTLDEWSYNDAREVNRFTFQLLRDLEVKTRESLSGNHSSLDLQRKLQVLSTIASITWSDSSDIDAMLTPFSSDDEEHDIERLLKAEQWVINDARDAATGVINDVLNAKRELLEWETEEERDARLVREAEAREAARYQWNPELLERAHDILNSLLSRYAQGENLSALITEQKTELEAVRSAFLTEVELAINESRTAAGVLQTEVLERGVDDNWTTGINIPWSESFQENLDRAAQEIERIYASDTEWNPIIWEEELIDYIKNISIDAYYNKTQEPTFQALVDSFNTNSPEERAEVESALREAYFESRRFESRLRQEATNNDLTIQLNWEERTFDNLLEKRRAIAVSLQVTKAFAEVAVNPSEIGIEKLWDLIWNMFSWGKDFLENLTETQYWLLGISLGFLWTPLWMKGILKMTESLKTRPNDVEVAELKGKLTRLQTFLSHIGEDKAAKRVWKIIKWPLLWGSITNFSTWKFLIQFHRKMYRQYVLLNITPLWGIRQLGGLLAEVNDQNALWPLDQTGRRSTEPHHLESLFQIAERYNTIFDDIEQSNLEESIKKRLKNQVVDIIISWKNINRNVIQDHIKNLEIVSAHNSLTVNSKWLIQDMILDGRLSTDETTMGGLFSSNMNPPWPWVALEIRIRLNQEWIALDNALYEDFFDMVIKDFLEWEALEDRIVTPEEVAELKIQAKKDIEYLIELNKKWMEVEHMKNMFELRNIDVNEDLFWVNWLENSRAHGILMALKAQLELDGRAGDITRLAEIIRDPRLIFDIDEIDTTNLATFKESLWQLFWIELQDMQSIEQVDAERGRFITVGDRTYELKWLTARERIALWVTRKEASLERRLAELVANGKAVEQLSDDSIEALRIKMSDAFEIITRAELQAEADGITGVDFDHFRNLATDGIVDLDLATMEADIKARTGFTDILDFRALVEEKLRVEWVATDEADSILRAFDNGTAIERLDPTLQTRSYFDYVRRAFKRGRV